MDIGSRIRQHREKNGLTQEELGKILGVNKATVNRYETGEIDIKRTTALKLAEAFKVSPAYIMGWVDSTEINSESAIIKKYNSLNSAGRMKVSEYINDLLANPNYTDKTTPTPSLGDYLEIAAYGGEGNRNPKKKLQILD